MPVLSAFPSSSSFSISCRSNLHNFDLYSCNPTSYLCNSRALLESGFTEPTFLNAADR